MIIFKLLSCLLNQISMKRLIIISVLLALLTVAYGQDTTKVESPWKFHGMTSLNFSQVSLVNWSQGGDNSQAFNALAVLNLDYTKDKSTWANILNVGYGIQKTGTNASGKTDDHIDFVSKYGYSTSKNWYISGLYNFKTQFSPGYKGQGAERSLISDFMSPGYMIVSIGMEYKPNDKFFLMLSPIGGKATFVLNDTLSAAGSYGVKAGDTFRMEMGASARVSLTQDIVKNVTLTTSMDLFSNLLDKPQNVDVNWTALVNMKINEFLSANISTTLLYDDNIKYIDSSGASHGARVQFKELFGVGLSFKF
jgi:hypothetical protein